MSGGIHTSVKSYIIAQKTNEDETSTSNSTAADSVVHPPPLSFSDMSMASASYGLNCDGCFPMLSSAAKSMVTTTGAESLPRTARIDLFPEHGLSGKHRRIKVGEEQTNEGTQDICVNLKELINATGNFSKKKIIGIGNLGTVYKAQLRGQSKSTVAVKRLSSHFKENIEKLKKEIKLLYAMNHTNVIKLFDFHIKKDLQLLVYEYMENGSLEDALSVGSITTRSLKFTWDTRFNICLGIARGLKYLHDHPMLNIAHMNIKAANILLDGNLEPRISDFGLAHLYAEEDQFADLKRQVSQGYMAPEYFQGTLTSKADVYSFGVILLEIVSWKKNVIRSNHRTEVLVNTASRKHEQGNLESMVDERLGTYNRQQALTVLKLAVMCTSLAPSLRPTMSDVMSVLGEKTIEDLIQSSPSDGEKIRGIGDLTHADSTGITCMDLTSLPSTSSPSTKAKDELESM